MVDNDAFYVSGAAIVNFDVISIENTVKFMIFWEVLIYKIKKVDTGLLNGRLSQVTFLLRFIFLFEL